MHTDKAEYLHQLSTQLYEGQQEGVVDMEEVWKAIPNFDGYEASSFGRIRSWWTPGKRGIGLGKGSGKRVLSNKPRLHKFSLDKDGYQDTSLTGNDGIHRRMRVHRLVAMAFIPNPGNLPQVNHKNENKSDNNVENLEWCDCTYNINYGTARRRAALKRMKQVARYDLNGNYIDSFESADEVMRKTGIRHIGSVCNKKRNSAGGYQWRYSNDTENISPIHYRIPKRRTVKVDCYDKNGLFVKSYDSLASASNDKNVAVCQISAVLKGRQITAHDYIWRYHDESGNIRNAT